MERAWERNQRAQAQADQRNERAMKRNADKPRAGAAKVVGGSTITQQLAKNLLLSGERTPLRKAQELVLTYALEACLSKRRILEIYLNNVEWGEGLFGAQAAARYYFRTDAAQLGAAPAARLAVMLPAPKRYEKRMGSGYLPSRGHGGRRAWVRWSCREQRRLMRLAAVARRGWWSKKASSTPPPSARRRATSAACAAARASSCRATRPWKTAVREHLALFHADTQPAELAALRGMALALDGAPGRVPPAPGGRGVARHGDAPVGHPHRPVLPTMRRRRRSR